MVADVVATIELLPGRRLPIMLLLGFEQLAGVLQRLLGGNPTRPGGRLPAGRGFLRRGFARGAGGARWLRHRPGRPGDALRGRLLPGRLPCGRFLRSRLLRSRSEEHTSELQSLMRISYAVFCLKKKTKN